MPVLPPQPLQFAVVREDPRVERRVIEDLSPRRVALIGSGGCTALALRAWFPDLRLTLIEPNPAQLAHLQQKMTALRRGAGPAAFNIGTDAPDGLHERGNFERLFRLFRRVLDLFVVPARDRADRCADRAATWDDVLQHPYWPVAFELAFADLMLTTMFGPAATQHAAPGSYPAYFRRRIEGGLAAPDRATNPWLHHVLLGHYLATKAAWPPFLQEPPADLRPFDERPTTLLDAPSFAPFDLVQLSNVVDWMSEADCHRLARRLGDELRPGAAVLWRQLNDPRDLVGMFSRHFDFDAARDRALTAGERSLFYDAVHLGIRR